MTDTNEIVPCASDALQTNEEEAHAIRYHGDEAYRIMADGMPQIVWSARPDGVRDYFNQRWYEHTEMTIAQTIGWGWVSALHEDDGARCMDAWTTAVQTQEHYECEYRLFCAEDGSYRWYMERALAVFAPDGCVIKWFGTCTDINELKCAQAQVEILNTRLRRAMTETHHRVKNNLQIISAMIDMQLMDGIETIPAAEFKRLSTHVRTLAAVHDILTQESKDEGSRQIISLTHILEKLLPVHQQTAPYCRIIARIEDVALPGRQGTSLALVVNELISNAIKHGKELVELVVAREDDHVNVTVCDDGPGFSTGFDVRTAANTGLELVDNLVRLDLGGQVLFANQPQGGAQVTLILPLRHTASTEAIQER
jgi:PAS domain S-box-containing protein